MSKGGRGGKSPANCSHSSTFSPVWRGAAGTPYLPLPRVAGALGIWHPRRNLASTFGA